MSERDAVARPLLLVGPTAVSRISAGATGDGVDGVRVRPIERLDRVAGAISADAPTVLLLDDELAPAGTDLAAALAALPAHVVVVAPETVEARLDGAADRVFLAFPDGNGRSDTGSDGAGEVARARTRALRAAFRHAAARAAAQHADAQLERARRDLRELSRIGMALMTERDPDRLLVAIVDRALTMTSSDAGSLYLVEDGPDGERRLRFKVSENRSLPDLPFDEFTLPIDRTSVAGFVAATTEPLVVDDAYAIPETEPYTINRSFDERFGYRTMSMLVVPLADHRDVVVGVLQLINRKRDPGAVLDGEAAARAHVLPYGDPDVALVRGLAGQAAVSIENARLYDQIEDLFESFVRASVVAIDERDPTTAGHSVRVAALTTRLADRLPRLTRGRWAGRVLSREEMKELRYAALLHDFGKVGVREEVLVKARKLPRHLWERVVGRFDLAHRTIEMEYLEKKLAVMRQVDAEGRDEAVAWLDAELERRLQQLDVFRAAVRQANEPAVLPEAEAAALEALEGRTFRGLDGDPAPYLRPEELAFLKIPRGSLDEAERKEIESHVTRTYRFLTRIPWTPELRNVPELAYGHHEKLAGHGYPRGLRDDDIPVQTRLLTIADIFDALTASDRPYKRAVAVDRSLDILRAEAGAGALDADLVDLLIESRVYEEILSTDWREL